MCAEGDKNGIPLLIIGLTVPFAVTRIAVSGLAVLTDVIMYRAFGIALLCEGYCKKVRTHILCKSNGGKGFLPVLLCFEIGCRVGKACLGMGVLLCFALQYFFIAFLCMLVHVSSLRPVRALGSSI